MGQLKVRFSIEHSEEQSSFASLYDLKQHSFSHLVLNRLNEFEIRLKCAAADIWLQQRLGRDNLSSFQITMALDNTTSEKTNSMPKA